MLDATEWNISFGARSVCNQCIMDMVRRMHGPATAESCCASESVFGALSICMMPGASFHGRGWHALAYRFLTR